MSQVYLAEDLKLGRKVAIKQVAIADSGLRAALLREARLLSKVRHPHVAGIHDFFEDGNNCCLVMEYIEGETLKQFRGLPQAWPAALAWLRQIAEALSYLHSQDPPIICRDLNPNNVLLSPDCKRVTLIDFGISKTLVPGTATATIVAGLGTAGYAPIEQYALKGGATNERSDLYALGCTLYFLLTGDDPPEAVQRSATDSDLDFGKATSLPDEVGKWLRRMTAIKPADRFSTISEAMSELEKAMPVSPAVSAGQRSAVHANAGRSTVSPAAAIQTNKRRFKWLDYPIRIGALVLTLNGVIDILGAFFTDLSPLPANAIYASTTMAVIKTFIGIAAIKDRKYAITAARVLTFCLSILQLVAVFYIVNTFKFKWSFTSEVFPVIFSLVVGFLSNLTTFILLSRASRTVTFCCALVAITVYLFEVWALVWP